MSLKNHSIQHKEIVPPTVSPKNNNQKRTQQQNTKTKLSRGIDVAKPIKTDGDIDGNAEEEDEETSELKQTRLIVASECRRSCLLRQTSQGCADNHQQQSPSPTYVPWKQPGFGLTACSCKQERAQTQQPLPCHSCIKV